MPATSSLGALTAMLTTGGILLLALVLDVGGLKIAFGAAVKGAREEKAVRRELGRRFEAIHDLLVPDNRNALVWGVCRLPGLTARLRDLATHSAEDITLEPWRRLPIGLALFLCGVSVAVLGILYWGPLPSSIPRPLPCRPQPHCTLLAIVASYFLGHLDLEQPRALRKPPSILLGGC